MEKNKKISLAVALILSVAFAFSGMIRYRNRQIRNLKDSLYKLETRMEEEHTALAGSMDAVAGDISGIKESQREQEEMREAVSRKLQKEIDGINRKLLEAESKEAKKEEEPESTEEQIADNADLIVIEPYETPEDGCLTKYSGIYWNGGQLETYYNLDMSVVVETAHANGIGGDYWIRSDGCKMLGEYIMIAANQSVHPYGSTVSTSLGTGIVVDTGGFAENNPKQIDIAVNW